jgi:hypothetical protein
VNLMENRGFETLSRDLIAFPAHRLFERHVASKYYRYIATGADQSTRRINANRSPFFRMMSALAVSFDRRTLWPDDGSRSGNSYYVFRKTGDRL